MSVTMYWGTAPIISTENDNFFSSVRTRNIISRSLSRTGRSNVEGFRVVRPASILDISRMSLIRARRCSPLRLMVPRYWLWRGVSEYDVARALRAEPTLAGVRLVAVSGYGQPEDR